MVTEKNETDVSFQIESIDGRPLDAYGYQTGKKWTADLAGEVARKLIGQVIDWSKFRPVGEVDSGIDVQYVLKASDGTTLSETFHHGAEISDPYNCYGESRDYSFWGKFPQRIAPEVVFSPEAKAKDGLWDVVQVHVATGKKSHLGYGGSARNAKDVADLLNETAMYMTPDARDIDMVIFEYEYDIYLNGTMKYIPAAALAVNAEVNEGPEP